VRVIERDVARRPHHAFDRVAGAAVAAQGIDRAGEQIDMAQRMVAGVGHIQRLPLQHQAVRPAEAGQGQFAIGETGGLHAELAQDAAGMGALEHAVVAAVGNEQALAGHRQSGRKPQRRSRLGMEFPRGVEIVIRRRLQSVAQRCDHSLQLRQRFQPDQPVADMALAIDQQHGRPGLDAEALPGDPVGVVADRHADAVPAQPLERLLRVAFAVEPGHMHRQRLQAPQIARLQLGDFVQPLPAPGRGGIDERQRDDPSALFVQRTAGSVEPLQALRKFRRDIHIHCPQHYAADSPGQQPRHDR
jgi:hypothetical protein